ncbi:hypothetical protein Barb6_03162 [Bacteroidales bacterium Barb6]|nr:hypothetical protein Barb6_03162 [Bacteroidales bacterium Barb6]
MTVVLFKTAEGNLQFLAFKNGTELVSVQQILFYGLQIRFVSPVDANGFQLGSIGKYINAYTDDRVGQFQRAQLRIIRKTPVADGGKTDMLA